jgi:mono/diheme cytochrome c family protein
MFLGFSAFITWIPFSWAADATDGKATYQKLCVACHGPDGKGNVAMTKAFGEKALNIATKETAQKSDDELLRVITQGRGKMPASGKSLSKQEQKQVLEHVRSFAK